MREGIIGNDGIKKYPIPTHIFQVTDIWRTIELDIEIEKYFCMIEGIQMGEEEQNIWSVNVPIPPNLFESIPKIQWGQK